MDEQPLLMEIIELPFGIKRKREEKKEFQSATMFAGEQLACLFTVGRCSFAPLLCTMAHSCLRVCARAGASNAWRQPLAFLTQSRQPVPPFPLCSPPANSTRRRSSPHPSLPTSSYPQLGLILALLRSLLAAPLIAGIVPSTGVFAAVPAMAAVSRSPWPGPSGASLFP